MTDTTLTQDQAKELAKGVKQIIRSCGYTDYDGSSQVMEVPISLEQLFEDLSNVPEWTAVQDSPDKFWIEAEEFGYEVLLVEGCSGWIVEKQRIMVFRSVEEGYITFKEDARVCIGLTDKNGRTWGVTSLGRESIECYKIHLEGDTENNTWEMLI